MAPGNGGEGPLGGAGMVGIDPIGESEYEQITLTARQARPWERPEQAALRGAVDIAAIGLMRDGLLRPSEFIAVRLCDLHREEDGSGRLTVVSSKTGQHSVCYVFASTITALDDMHSARQALGREDTEDTDDRLFRMSRARLSRRIREACSNAGLRGRYGGQSPRVGVVQDMGRAGFPMAAIMEAGRMGPMAVSRHLGRC